MPGRGARTRGGSGAQGRGVRFRGGGRGRGGSRAISRSNAPDKSMVVDVLRHPSTLEPMVNEQQDWAGSTARVLEASPVEEPFPIMLIKMEETPQVGESGTPMHSMRDTEISELLNYGSEDDPEDSDDGADDEPTSCPLGIPRIAQCLMETPEDESEAMPEEPPSSSWVSNPLYNFEWHPFPNPPILPESRREKFANNNCGPTIPFTDPYDIFVRIWDQDIMETIASETNRYAQQLVEQKTYSGHLRHSSRICDWKDTTPAELYIYFGIVLAIGVVVKSVLTEYWSTSCHSIFTTPGFRAQMPLRRFQILSKCLHFSDNRALAGKNLSVSDAKIMKIKPLADNINNKFQTLYNLNQNIALDESLLQWKGWLNINQFIPNKVASVGIKTYEVCESQTGYLWRFFIHASSGRTGSVATQDPLDATTPALVLQLLHGLEHKGHTVWMDNFFNSPILARKLKSLGFDCVGTLRTNRLCVPREIMNLKKSEMVEGQIVGVTSGDVDVMVWRDQNRVATISTYHGNSVCTDSNGKIKPILIRDYNVMMGGVDKKDQLLSMYPIERKRTKVWYKKLFRRLLNVSVLNAYIIHKHNAKNKALSHRNFRMKLVERMLSDNDIPPLPPKVSSRDVRDHYPSEYDFLPSGRERSRRRCSVCHKRTTVYCVGCDKPACISKCFKNLHL